MVNERLYIEPWIGIYLFFALIIWISGIGGDEIHLVALLIPLLISLLYLTANHFFQLKIRSIAFFVSGIVRKVPPLLYVVGISLLFLIIWSIAYIHKYEVFELANFDAGIYSNVAYNIAHGDPFYSSVLLKNHLGEHFSPIMALFAPLYRLKPDVRWLLGAQILSYISVPLFIYRISSKYTRDTFQLTSISLLLGIAWFLYFPMRSAMDFPFHPSTLATPFIFWSFALLEEDKYVPMTFLLGFTVFFKENLPLVWCGFALYMFFNKREYIKSFLLLAASLLTALIVTGIIIPGFGDGDYGKLSLLAPFQDLHLKLEYFVRLLLPLGLLPLFFWRRGIIALPALAQNLLVNRSEMYSFRFHYDDLTSPLLFCILPGLIFCIILHRIQKISYLRKATLLIICIATAFLFSKPSPLKNVWNNPVENKHHQLRADLERLQIQFPTSPLYLQHPLFPYLNRPFTFTFEADKASCDISSFERGSIIVLEPTMSDWRIKDLNLCLKEMDTYSFTRKIDNYERLKVYLVER